MTAQPQTARPQGLLRNTVIMGLGSLASRGLGIIRVIVLGIIIASSSPPGELVTMATQLPTIIYFLIAGSVLNNVFMPQIVRATKNDADGGEAYINRMVTMFLTVLGLATVLCTVFAPQLLGLQMSASWRTPAMQPWYDMLLLMLKLSMVQIFFYGAYYIFGQVLNARSVFGPMMWAPVVSNIAQILLYLGYLLMWGVQPSTQVFTPTQGRYLAIGMTVAVGLQVVVMIPFLRKAGVRYRPRFDWKGTGLGSTITAFKWVLLAALFSQIVTFIQTHLASYAIGKDAHAAGQAVYNWAYTIWMVPHGLITVSLATALMPDLTRMAVDNDMQGVARETLSTLRMSLTLMVPITAALTFLALPVCQLLMGWGANRSSVTLIAWTLVAFSLSYPVYTFFYIINRAFFALEDTKSAFKITIVTDVFVLGFSVLGVLVFGQPRWIAPILALTTTLAVIPGSVYGWKVLNRRLQTSLAEVFRLAVRLVLCAVPAGYLALRGEDMIASMIPGQFGVLVGLLLAGVVGVGVFLGLSRLFHIEDVAEIIGVLQRRLRGRRGAASLAPEVSPLSDVLLDAEGDLDGPQTLEQFIAPLAEEPLPPVEEDPDTLHDVFTRVSAVHVGDLLGERYRLDLLIARRGGTLTWRAFDTILQRDVLIHILAPHEERSTDILVAARRASVATDSRFLRVLDAVHSDDDDLGSYVVCEFTQGYSLEQLLARGPLTALESGWIARELSEALIGVHANGLYHERLNPDTVLISSNGNVKIVGFLIEKAIHPSPGDDELSEVEREARDIEAVGALLFACLAGRWPGAGYGMPATPVDATGFLTPRQVKAGISPVLDLVTDQIINRPPRSKNAPLRTASEVYAATMKIIGTADAAPDLERRIRRTSRSISASTAASARSASSAAAASAVSASLPDETPTTVIPVAKPESPLSDRPAPYTPVPPPATTSQPLIEELPDRPARRALPRPRTVAPLLLVGLILLALVTGIGLTISKLGRGSSADPSGTKTSAIAPPAKRTIAGVKDFDPLGSRGEMPQTLPLSYDGDPETAWTTETYQPAVWQKKHAVGMFVDLGAMQKVSRVDLNLLGAPSSLQIMVPKENNPAQAPTEIDDWTAVATKNEVGADVSISFDPTNTRYVLVWFTELPKEKNYYRGGIAEVSVWG